MKLLIRSVFFCLAFCFANIAQATEIAGVKIDKTMHVSAPGAAPATLKLNGAGIRNKIFFFRVYVAALYLNEIKNTAKGVVEIAGPKLMKLTMLREVKSDVFWQAFNDGFKENTDPAEMAKLSNQFSQLEQLFATVKELKRGDVISIEWLPDVGTTILMNNKKIGEKFPDVAFFNALLRIWIGDKPVDRSLKKQLLSGTAIATK